MRRVRAARHLVGAALCVAGSLTAPLQAQTRRLVVLAPQPATAGDSAYAIAFAAAFRDGLSPRTLRDFSVRASDKIYTNDASAQMARALQADAYIAGRIESRPVPRVDLHLVDVRRTGLVGWVHAVGVAGMTVKDLAGVAADSMDAQLKAAEATRSCLERRDRRDFNGAKQRAREAFESVPNHPGAAMCLAITFETIQAPPDSEISVLERATAGDSIYVRAWEMLGRAYQAKETHVDSLKAADAFYRQLEADPGDKRLRYGVAALFITLGGYHRARDILDEGLKGDPKDLTALQLKARACEDGAMWDCLVEALAPQYEVDPTLVGRLDFYGKIFGAAQQAGDTAAMLKWSGEALKHLPQNRIVDLMRLEAFKATGMMDSVKARESQIAQLGGGSATSTPAQTQAGPFGLTAGSSRAQLERIAGPLTQLRYGVFSTSTMPNGHAWFDSYLLILTDSVGLCKVVATSKTVEMNSFGEQLRARFDDVKDALTQKYGQSQVADFVRAGSIWTEPQDWAMGLLKEERTLAAFWDLSPAPRSDRVRNVALDAHASSVSTGYVSLGYEFDTAPRCLAEIKRKANVVF